MNPGDDEVDLREQVRAVKDNVIVQKTAPIYVRGICRYVAWLYRRKRHLLRDTFLGNLRSSDLGQDDSGIASLKLNSIDRFMEENREVSPLNYNLHEPDDFEEFLKSLSGRSGGKPGRSVYDSMRSSLFYLYRGYGQTMSPKILESLRSNNHHQIQHNDAAHDGVIDEHSDTLQNALQTLSLVNERFSRVTADFHIPGMSLMTAWEHWCCGDPSGRIGPYRFLQWRDLSSSKKRKTLSNYRCMMMEIQTKIPHCSWISAPTIQQAREMLQSVLAKLPVSDVTPKKRQRRKDQLK